MALSKISGTQIEDLSLSADDLADGAVTAAKLAAGAAVPDQSGHAGKFLTTDGTTASWAEVIIPDEVVKSSTAPSSPTAGDLWYDIGTKTLKLYNGTAWIDGIVGTGSASGGNTTNDTVISGTSYRVHTFTQSGFLTISNADIDIDYLLVAGGGSGGQHNAGGGGAGGLLSGSKTLTPGTYQIIIGPGGAARTSDGAGNNGTDTEAFGLTAVGGGGGASQASGTAAGNGGSGGGGSGFNGGGAQNNALYGTGTTGQGNDGGGGNSGQDLGGGGGAGGVGQNGVDGTAAGDGGPGLQSNIDGNNYYYAGGGGGAAFEAGDAAGDGGIGGGGGGGGGYSASFGYGGGSARNAGGNGTSTSDSAANDSGGNGGINTGGGGGGKSRGSPGSSGQGGSGIVIVRYAI